MLKADAQNLYSIVFPLHMGKYKYKRLPMGIKIAWFLILFKNFVSKLVQDLEYVETNMLS
jgi:hypothetical protein